jgi:hypothetical protein
MHTEQIVNFIFYGLALTYAIFMLIYLGNAKKCDQYLNPTDRRFRKAAYIITWIEVVLVGITLAGMLITGLMYLSRGSSGYSKVGFW